MVRRALVFVLAAVSLLAAGCTGADAQRAQELLAEAQAAEANLDSMSFVIRVWAEMDGQSFSIRLAGGGYLKGERAGDMVLAGTGEGLGSTMPPFRVLSLGGRMYMESNGVRQEIPASAADQALQSQLEQFDITRYVTDVRVTPGPDFAGESETRIEGVIDTSSLVGGLFEELGTLTQLGGSSLPDVAEGFGDTRVALYVSDTTHLVRAAMITMPMDIQGEKLEIHVDLVVRSVNQPIPELDS